MNGHVQIAAISAKSHISKLFLDFLSGISIKYIPVHIFNAMLFEYMDWDIYCRYKLLFFHVIYDNICHLP